MGKRIDREGPVQRAIIKFIETQYPRWMVHHCKNEIKQRGKSIAIEISKAKINGMVVGFPDLVVLPSNKPAVFLEVKAEGNYASPAQKQVHADLEALGHRVAVVRGVEDVKEVFAAWGMA